MDFSVILFPLKLTRNRIDTAQAAQQLNKIVLNCTNFGTFFLKLMMFQIGI